MFQSPVYFHNLTRKFVDLFGTLFNDIQIIRTDDGANTQLIDVPIKYASKEKMLERVIADPNIDKKSAITLPVMSFEITSISYDAERKLNSTNRLIYQANSTSGPVYQWQSVPYNIGFTLQIYAKNRMDGNKIYEQILPHFSPAYNVKADLIPEMGVVNINIPIIMDSQGVQADIQDQGSFANRTIMIWTLDFTMKTFFYGPIKETGIIKWANTIFYTPSVENIADGVGTTNPIEYIYIRPGLTANGQPTSNASISVSYTEINVDDNYGYIQEIKDWNS